LRIAIAQCAESARTNPPGLTVSGREDFRLLRAGLAVFNDGYLFAAVIHQRNRPAAGDRRRNLKATCPSLPLTKHRSWRPTVSMSEPSPPAEDARPSTASRRLRLDPGCGSAPWQGAARVTEMWFVAGLTRTAGAERCRTAPRCPSRDCLPDGASGLVAHGIEARHPRLCPQRGLPMHLRPAGKLVFDRI
jgi:hypothetical protein